MQASECDRKNLYNYCDIGKNDQISFERHIPSGKYPKYPSLFKRGFINTIFFKWLSPLIDVCINGGYIHDNEINLADDDNDIKIEYEYFIRNWNEEFSDPNNIKSIQISTFKVIFRTFYLRIISILAFKFVFDIIYMLRPWQIHGVLFWINDPNGTRSSGILRFFSIVVCEIVSGSILQQYFRRSFSLSVMLKGVLNYSLSHKLVNLPKNIAHENISKCISLFSSESTYLLSTGNTLLAVPSMIFQNLLLLLSLYRFIGISAFIGYIIIVLSLFVNGILLKATQSIRLKYIGSMDRRISLSNELVHSFKQIKCYAWESYYLKNIEFIRNEELKHLAIWRFLNQLGFVLATLCISLSPVISFGSFLFITRSFPADVIFTSLLIFEALQLTLVLMPTGLSSLQKVMNCYTRLSEFLLLKESTPKEMILDFAKVESAIIVDNVSFNYPSKDDILHSININVKKKETIGIIGSVGSGKTTLIELILQEIYPRIGSVRTDGSIFYCSQVSWIINSSIRNNIILDLPYDKKWYDTVVSACSLVYDIKAMPNGDLTEIGENGVNLSGGQKQRVSLARAVYQNPDILILDDVFSALDNVVANSIFQKCILNLMSEKTIVLATNKLDLLVHLDKVAFIKDQTLCYYGPTNSTFFSHSDFQDFLKNMNKVQDQINQLIDDIVPIEEIEEIEEINSKNQNNILSDNNDSINNGLKISNTITNMSLDLEEINKDSSPFSLVDSSSTSNQMKIFNNNLVNEITPDRSRRGSRVSLSILKEKYRRESQVKKLSEPNLNKLPIEKGNIFKFDQDKVSIEKVEISLYVNFIRKVRLWIFLVCLTITYACTFLSIVSSIWISIWSKNFEKYGIMKGLLILSAINFMQPILNLAFRMTNIYMMAYASKRIYSELLEKLAFSKMSFYESIPIGTILTRITSDTVVVDEMIPQNLNDLLFCFSRVTVYIGYFIYLDYRFLFLFIPLSYLFNRVRDRALSANRQLKRIYHSRNSPILTSISYTIEGLAILRCSKSGLNNFLRRIQELIDYETAPWRCYCLVQRWLGIRVDMLGACVMFSLGIFCVLAKNHLSIGAIAIAFQCSVPLTQLVLWMIRNISETENNFLSFERVVELIENTPQEQTLKEYQTFENKDKDINNIYSDSLLLNIDKSNIIQSNWPTEGKIVFRDVLLHYNIDEPAILNNLSFSIPGGKKVGICGRTGSGKSSLLSVILRLYDIQKGSILIDDVDISQVSFKQLRSLITIIPQEPNLLTGTLRYNLDPFGEHTKEEIEEALVNSNSISFVNSLPQGIDTQLSSISNNISLGQKQLICLARAMLRNSKIILLDEATSSMDIATDSVIQNIVKKHFSNCTILSIAHRIHTIIDFDLIIVLDKGRIVEYDTPHNLLSNTSSIFYSIANEINSL